jgi:hypothetical protein
MQRSCEVRDCTTKRAKWWRNGDGNEQAILAYKTPEKRHNLKNPKAKRLRLVVMLEELIDRSAKDDFRQNLSYFSDTNGV